MFLCFVVYLYKVKRFKHILKPNFITQRKYTCNYKTLFDFKDNEYIVRRTYDKYYKILPSKRLVCRTLYIESKETMFYKLLLMFDKTFTELYHDKFKERTIHIFIKSNNLIPKGFFHVL